MIPEKGQFSFDEVWKKVEATQLGYDERLLTEKDVKEAIRLRKESARMAVLAWGGFVPYSGSRNKRDKNKFFATKLVLLYNGKMFCSRDNACRTFGQRKKIFATGPIFGLLWPHKKPKDMPTITNEGELLYPLSKAELLDIMLKNRKYGRIVRWLQENDRVCER